MVARQIPCSCVCKSWCSLIKTRVSFKPISRKIDPYSDLTSERAPTWFCLVVATPFVDAHFATPPPKVQNQQKKKQNPNRRRHHNQTQQEKYRSPTTPSDHTMRGNPLPPLAKIVVAFQIFRLALQTIVLLLHFLSPAPYFSLFNFDSFLF